MSTLTNSIAVETATLGAAHLAVLQHAIGADTFGRRARHSHRNHFVTGKSSGDHDLCLRLVDEGLMARTPGNAITGGDDLFRVTHEGVVYMSVHRPAPPPEPKLTRSQLRYREWLNADPGYSFAEWIGVPRSGRRYG